MQYRLNSRIIREADESASRSRLEALAVPQSDRPGYFSRPVGVEPFDIEYVETAAWRRIMACDPALAEPGNRLYLLSFLGPVPYIKIGRTGQGLERVDRHVSEAHRHLCFLADGWVSAPVPFDLRNSEERLMRALGGAGGARFLGGSIEVFYGLTFEEAMKAASAVVIEP